MLPNKVSRFLVSPPPPLPTLTLKVAVPEAGHSSFLVAYYWKCKSTKTNCGSEIRKGGGRDGGWGALLHGDGVGIPY